MSSITRRDSLTAIAACCAAPIATLSAENGSTAPLRLTAREERVIRGFRRVADEDGREVIEMLIDVCSPERVAKRKALTRGQKSAIGQIVESYGDANAEAAARKAAQ